MRRILIALAGAVACVGAPGMTAGAWAKEEKRPQTTYNSAKSNTAGIAFGAGINTHSSNTSLKTPAGTVDCAATELTGTMGTNAAKKDTMTFDEGLARGEEKEGSTCSSTTGLGPASVALGGFPWHYTSTTTGKVTLTGTPKILYAATFPAAGGVKCQFEASKLTGAFKIGGPVLLELSGALKLNKKMSQPSCPSGAGLSGSSSMTTEGEVVETK